MLVCQNVGKIINSHLNLCAFKGICRYFFQSSYLLTYFSLVRGKYFPWAQKHPNCRSIDRGALSDYFCVLWLLLSMISTEIFKFNNSRFFYFSYISLYNLRNTENLLLKQFDLLFILCNFGNFTSVGM